MLNCVAAYFGVGAEPQNFCVAGSSFKEKKFPETASSYSTQTANRAANVSPKPTPTDQALATVSVKRHLYSPFHLHPSFMVEHGITTGVCAALLSLP